MPWLGRQKSGWWFQTFFIFHNKKGMSSFPLTNSIIFQDGSNHQPDIIYIIDYILYYITVYIILYNYIYIDISQLLRKHQNISKPWKASDFLTAEQVAPQNWGSNSIRSAVVNESKNGLQEFYHKHDPAKASKESIDTILQKNSKDLNIAFGGFRCCNMLQLTFVLFGQ